MFGLSFLYQIVNCSLYRHPTLSPYTSLFDHVIQHESTVSAPELSNLRYLSPHQSHIQSIPSAPIDPYGPSYRFNTLYGSVTPANNQHHNQLDNNLNDLTYVVDGRLLKQYFVMEHHEDDNTLDIYDNAFQKHLYLPFLPNLNLHPSNRRNYGFPIANNPATISNQMPSQQRNAQLNYGPIAVGSGSLGFVRHPSGAVFLGSGSLGYINDQQRIDAITNIQNRQTPEPGPLSFGHTPK